MTTYHVTAKRWALGWELHVDGVGVTQCRTLATAEATAREYIALDRDIEDEHSFGVTVAPELDADLAAEADAAQHEADEARHRAAERTRKAVRDLKASGLSGSDVATMLGVSTQRVSQLVRS